MDSFNSQWMKMAEQGEVRPIRYEGQDVHPSYRFSIAPGHKLVITRLGAKSSPVQGLRIKARGKKMKIAGTEAKSFVLWCDTAPECVTVEFMIKAVAEVNIWNCWRDRDGDEMHSIGNDGVVIEQSEGTTTLRFSDGTGAPDFTALVAKVEIVKTGVAGESD